MASAAVFQSFEDNKFYFANNSAEENKLFIGACMDMIASGEEKWHGSARLRYNIQAVERLMNKAIEWRNQNVAPVANESSSGFSLADLSERFG